MDALEGRTRDRVRRGAPGARGLERDRAQVVTGDVVHVAGDPQPLLDHRALDVAVAQLGDPLRGLVRLAGAFTLAADRIADQRRRDADRDTTEDPHRHRALVAGDPTAAAMTVPAYAASGTVTRRALRSTAPLQSIRATSTGGITR